MNNKQKLKTFRRKNEQNKREWKCNNLMIVLRNDNANDF